LEFSLAPAAAVSGRVFDQNGVGVPQARVWLQYHGESRAWQLAEEHGGEESDAFGNFVIPVVAQGRPFVLHAESDGWLLSTSRTMVIRGQELTGVSLLLSRRGATVSGQVVDSAGRGVSGVAVRLRAIAADTEFSEQQRQSIAFSRSMNRVTVSGPDGSYHFSGVPTGRAVVSADGRGRQVGVERDITTGRETRVDLRLP
jgi:hypothetical protein